MTWRERLTAWRWPGIAFFRLRLFFRGVFLLLALATVAIALSVLQDEKELSHRSYREGFAKTMGQVAAQLRHPAGQLALLNPPAPAASAASSTAGAVHPLVLPFSALDFDDHNKVEQAVEMAGCTRQYPGDAALCVALGSNPYAGGFVYVVGHALSPPPVAHATGEHDLTLSHRLRVDVTLRGRHYGWIAPFEPEPATAVNVIRGRLTGFAEDAGGNVLPRPVRDFRGWLWQGGPCVDGGTDVAACARRAFFSVRLPVEVLHDDVVTSPHPVWPPADMNRIDVRVQWLAPGADTPLFDSARAGATAPFSLGDLATQLLPGETLQLRKLGSSTNPADEPLATIKGVLPPTPPASNWMPQAVNDFLGRAVRGLLRRLPVAGEDVPIEATETIRTAAGSYELHGFGDERSANRGLAVVATRVSWFVVAMLVALALAWGAIEWTIIRRITMLTKRSRAVTAAVVMEDGSAAPSPAGRWSTLDIADLRSPDELGVLATCLAELLQRVDESMQRERLRAEREKDQWMAVGHEIMSPLQSLIALHGAPDDASRRYILRMQQAIRVLYGSASPSEAFQSTTLQLATLELDAFLAEVAANAPHAGIVDVRYDGPGEAVVVRADEYPLEDVITHVLQNAQRHRRAGTPITLRLRADDARATVELCNEGDAIPPELIDKIFEYGVSGAHEAEAASDATAPQRGQGLFVAKTYMAKMGGTVAAENVDGGVRIVLTLPRVTG